MWVNKVDSALFNETCECVVCASLFFKVSFDSTNHRRNFLKKI